MSDLQTEASRRLLTDPALFSIDPQVLIAHAAAIEAEAAQPAPDGLTARLEEYLTDEGNHVGGVWGDYGQVVVDTSDLWHFITGTERKWEKTSDYAATFNQMREALEAAEERLAALREGETP